ncbi:unnamed protein product [Owenia fusiformis]|uniref:F5/8 type C domain-containing protein n=1 Tax=Owenia fusiformis TaxID=6347 RepID=A0A8S4N5B1_OWEFU|nr:unnamed protein product [Owenia fusiformis]
MDVQKFVNSNGDRTYDPSSEIWKMGVVLNAIVIFFFFFKISFVKTDSVNVAIDLSKHQPHILSYKKLPNAERLGSPLKTLKVLTNTRCEATCSAIPDMCDSYKLRRVNDDTFKYSCELFGPCVAQQPTNSTSLDVDHYVREGCYLESGLISPVPDSALSASSRFNVDTDAVRSRLNDVAWAAGIRNTNQWIQVDFGSTMRVTGVGTKGRHSNIVY